MRERGGGGGKREREGREEESVGVQENGYLFPLVAALLCGPTGSLKMLLNKLKLRGVGRVIQCFKELNRGGAAQEGNFITTNGTGVGHISG